MAPTNEEEEKLVKYQDELEDLDPAEKFVKEVLRIPFAFAKIEVMLYKESFQDEVSHLSSSFSMLEVYIYIYKYFSFFFEGYNFFSFKPT